jgi:hypothetical protein
MMQIGGELHENYATIKPYRRSQVCDINWQDDEIYYKNVSNREVIPYETKSPTCRLKANCLLLKCYASIFAS